MVGAGDLIRIGELVKLAADTARAFSDPAPNGELSRVADIADRMDAVADELIVVGKEIKRTASGRR